MTLSPGAVVRDAWTLCRRECDVISAIAGVFVFLPVLTWLLLVPEPVVPAGATSDQRTGLMIAWAGEHLHWLALRVGCELFASVAVLCYLLGRERPDVREALRRALALLPAYAIAVMCGWGLVTLGLFALIVPGIYCYGRLALVAPVLVAERGVGVGGAIWRSLALTHGNGWRLTGVFAMPLLMGLLALQLIGSADFALSGGGVGNPLAKAIVEGLAAAVATASGVARMVLQTAAYRRLTVSNARR